MEILGEIADLLTPDDEGGTSIDDEDDSDNRSDKSDDEDEETETCYDAYFGDNETIGMSKKKTLYIYRNENQLDEAISAKKPLAGIVEVSKRDGKTVFEFELVFRKPVKQFARRLVEFDDSNGVFCHGLWCADISVKEEIVQCTDAFADVQAAAKLAAIAIPLWYILGKQHPNSNKYCVITNWWKYRMQDGWYRLPTLDTSLYGKRLSSIPRLIGKSPAMNPWMWKNQKLESTLLME